MATPSRMDFWIQLSKTEERVERLGLLCGSRVWVWRRLSEDPHGALGCPLVASALYLPMEMLAEWLATSPSYAMWTLWVRWDNFCHLENSVSQDAFLLFGGLHLEPGNKTAHPYSSFFFFCFLFFLDRILCSSMAGLNLSYRPGWSWTQRFICLSLCLYKKIINWKIFLESCPRAFQLIHWYRKI